VLTRNRGERVSESAPFVVRKEDTAKISHVKRKFSKRGEKRSGAGCNSGNY